MAQKPETVFRGRVDKDLKTLKNAWFESIQQLSIKGTPDKIGTINGIFIGLEIKKDGELEPLQAYKGRKIREAGGLWYEVTPGNWKDIFQTLKKLSQSSFAKSYLQES